MGKDKINHLECIKIAFKMIYEVDKNSFAITIILSIVSGVFPFLVLKNDGKYNINKVVGNWFENGQELSGGQWQKIAIARTM